MSNYPQQFKLTGKVALISGAATGIGAAVSEALGQCGATVVFTDRDQAAGEQQLAALQAAGIDALFIQQDVTLEEDWQRVAATVDERFGRLDILVNNAGILTSATIEELTLDSFRQVQAVNVEGVFLGSKHCLALLKKYASPEERSSIINLSSLAGLQGPAMMTAYSTSKGAVRLMTKAMASELGPVHVRVNSVHPGLINTNMGDQVQDLLIARYGLGSREEAEAFECQMTPLRSYGAPSDVAAAIVFLASSASNFISGSELMVDGGIFGCQ